MLLPENHEQALVLEAERLGIEPTYFHPLSALRARVDVVKGRDIDIIYNHTRLCMHDCLICCVDAIFVDRRREKDGSNVVTIEIPHSDSDIIVKRHFFKAIKKNKFDQAADIITTLQGTTESEIVIIDSEPLGRNRFHIQFKIGDGTNQILGETTIPDDDTDHRTHISNELLKLTNELSTEQKIEMLWNLKREADRHGHKIRLDISGGDPLASPDGFTLLQHASRIFGREGITMTATGQGLKLLTMAQKAELPHLICELNITFDGSTTYRPNGTYADLNLTVAKELIQKGVTVRAECPLTTNNCSPTTLSEMYQQLTDAGVSKFLIMRLFSVGRAPSTCEVEPSRQQYLEAWTQLKNLEANSDDGPEVKAQCALKALVGEQKRGLNACDLLYESLGLQPDGTLLLSAWAYGCGGGPLHESWVLGNLHSDDLQSLFLSAKVMQLAPHLEQNRGHCKMKAWQNSDEADHLLRMCQPSDPLYLEVATPSAATILPTVEICNTCSNLEELCLCA